MKVSWQVTGIRRDAYAAAHRIPVEEDKTGDERGKYVHPEEHGMPARFGVHYDRRQKLEGDLQAMERAHPELTRTGGRPESSRPQ